MGVNVYGTTMVVWATFRLTVKRRPGFMRHSVTLHFWLRSLLGYTSSELDFTLESWELSDSSFWVASVSDVLVCSTSVCSWPMRFCKPWISSPFYTHTLQAGRSGLAVTCLTAVWDSERIRFESHRGQLCLSRQPLHTLTAVQWRNFCLKSGGTKLEVCL